MDKIMNKIVSKNYKKAFIYFVVLTVVFILVSGGTCFGVFGNRLKDLSNTMEQEEKIKEDRNEKTVNDEHYEDDKHYEHHEEKKISEDKIKEIINLSTGEKVLIGVFTIAGILLFIWYWILVIGLTIKLAIKLGTNHFVFGWLAFFVNIGAIIILFIYKHSCKVCDSCGKIQSRKAAYCKNCGNQLDNICTSCGNHGSKKDIYCSNCGKKY